MDHASDSTWREWLEQGAKRPLGLDPSEVGPADYPPLTLTLTASETPLVSTILVGPVGLEPTTLQLRAGCSEPTELWTRRCGGGI